MAVSSAHGPARDVYPLAPPGLPFNATAHPTAEWMARQLLEPCGTDEMPRYLIRDRDSIYGDAFHHPTAALQIAEITTARQSPWQNPYAERVIGSIPENASTIWSYWENAT